MAFNNATKFAKVMMKFPPPNALQITYPRTWDTNESLGWIGAAVQDGIDGAKQQLIQNILSTTGGNFYKAHQAQNKFGINPRNVVIFNDLPFRTINMGWSLKAVSKSQLEGWIEAIDKLKAGSAPRLLKDGAVFDVEDCFFTCIIKSPGSGLIFFKSQEVVITSVDVNYTPQNFWAQFKDGNPVAIDLQLEMAETKLATRDKLESGQMV